MASEPIPTTFSDFQINLPKSPLPTLMKPSEEPLKRYYQSDQLAKFRQSNIIKKKLQNCAESFRTRVYVCTSNLYSKL